MLKSVSEEIRDCYKQAEACARQAAAQTDPKLRKDFLALEAAWLKLARLRETDLSDRIRERAYEIWIASGYRSGEAEQHWLAAEREILSTLQSEAVIKAPAKRITGRTIRPFLARQAFEPDVVRNMSLAFDSARKVLGLRTREDPATTRVAQKVIELAQRGIRDVATLRAMTLKEFNREE